MANRPISKDFNNYLYHFINEENQHIWWFENFCNKYAGKYYSNKNLEKAILKDDYIVLAIVSLARILIFEEIGHFYNVNISKSKIVNGFIREINEAHKNDEARHITFGREVLKDLVSTSPLVNDLSRKDLVANHLISFINNTINSLYNPETYRDAQLDQIFLTRGLTLRNNILNSEERLNFNKKNFFDPILEVLKNVNIL